MAQLFANNASGKLLSSISDTETVIQLELGEGVVFPTPTNGDYFLVTLTNGGGTEDKWEIAKCTARVGGALTVSRGQEGTLARGWPTGTKVELRVTAGTITQIYSSVSSVDEQLALQVRKIKTSLLIGS